MKTIESIPIGSGHPAAKDYLLSHSDEYFYCNRERCVMRKTSCLQYQRESEKKLHCKYGTYLLRTTPNKACERANCWGCEQGKRIKNEA